jgi:two-component system alkaline phosphatase synthesis response regulator PhoP
LEQGGQIVTEKLRIMIIEDHPSTINLLSYILEDAGYDPIPAYGGRDGLRLLRSQGADLVLLDLMMGDMDGWSVLRAIRNDESLAHIPVLIVTARHQVQEEHLIESHDGLFDGYVMKPFSVDELLSKIDETLARPAAGAPR